MPVFKTFKKRLLYNGGNMKIQKVSDNEFKITAEQGEISFDLESFEDLYFAVPVNNTGFYRLLFDVVVQDSENRKLLDSIITSLPDKEEGLTELQNEIQKIGKELGLD